MSVLYRALARAAKSRGDGGGAAAPAISSRRRGGGGFRRLLVVLIVLIVAAVAVYEIYGDEIVSEVTVIVFGEPTPPPPLPKKTQPGAAQKPVPAAQAPTPTEPANAGATPAAAANTALTPVPATVPTEAPSTPAISTPTPASAPPSGAAPVITAPVVAAAAPILRPAAPAPQPGKAATVTPEQDLPAILDRIRQQRTKATLQPSAVVDRTPATMANDTAESSAVGNMVSVETTPDQQRDDTERAYDLLLHGQYEGALSLYNSVLKVIPDSVAALLGKAIALHKLNRLTEARPLYGKVLAIDPNNREALTNMMSIIAAQAPAAALSELRNLQKTYPAFSPIAAQIAEIDAQTGNLADAISSFNRAIGLSPENGLYRLNLAIIQDRAGMTKEAVASYDAALDRLGDNAQLPIPIESIRARLRYLRSR